MEKQKGRGLAYRRNVKGCLEKMQEMENYHFAFIMIKIGSDKNYEWKLNQRENFDLMRSKTKEEILMRSKIFSSISQKTA